MPRRLLVLLTLSLAALLLLWKLDYAPFWNPDEGRYSSASYEMAFGLDGTQPDWVVPHLNGVARLNKPPLIYWLTGGMFKLLGPSEIAGRLPSVLASLGVMFVLFFWGRAALGTRAGLAGALVWVTSAFPFAMGRVANTDMLLCGSIALAAFGVYWSIESQRKLLFGAMAGVGMGLALLSKGPVGLAFPLIIAAIYLTAIKGWKRAPWGALVVAILVALAIGAPWYLAVEARHPGWIKQFVLEENLGRFSGKEQFHKPTSKFFYLPILLVGMLPWTGFMLSSLGRFEATSTRAGRTKLFLAIFAGFITLFFSMSGTKLVSYVLPAFPALALFTGICVAQYEHWNRTQRTLALAISVLLNVVLGVAIAVKPGALIDDKIMPREVGMPWALAICGILALSSAWLLIAARRQNGRAVLTAQVGTGFLLLGVLIPLVGQIGRYEDASGLLKALQPRLQASDRLGVYLDFVPTAIFYARRRTTFFQFRNSSGLDETELQHSPYFLPAEKIGEFVKAGPGRAFIISNGPIWPAAATGLWFWGRNNDWFLYSTEHKPQDFEYEFFAPKKEEKRIKKPMGN